MTALTGVSAEAANRLARVLSFLARQTSARAILLTDRGGNILVNNPPTAGREIETIAALGAGSFVATRELAGILGEPGFHSLLHHGDQASIYMHSLASDHLVIVVFGPGTTAGLVKLYVDKARVELDLILRDPDAAGGGTTAGQGFEMDGDADIFGDGGRGDDKSGR